MTDKDTYQAEIFYNRISKKYKELKKWARKNRVTCFRLYDKDIPEIPLSVDVYEALPFDVDGPMEAARFLSAQNARISANDLTVENDIASRRYAVVYLYERPYEKDQNDEKEWLSLMCKQTAKLLKLQPDHIILKERKQQKGTKQYEKNEEQPLVITVSECGALFKINLSSYLDTGLFFDHRPLRNIVRDECSGKKVLNLFCYTGSFSVYAAGGNASGVESWDLSNTYLSWAKENLELNGFVEKSKYSFTRCDVIGMLEEKAKMNLSEKERFDIIILDPPTFSNSKMSKNILDINRDWPKLVSDCLDLLNENGKLYFSTNSKRLIFEESKLPQNTKYGFSISAKDITSRTIDKDFEGSKCHKAWEISVKKPEPDQIIKF